MHLQRQSEPSEVIRTWSTSPRACRTRDEPGVPAGCPPGPHQPQQTITANSLTAACPEISHCSWGSWLCPKEPEALSSPEHPVPPLCTQADSDEAQAAAHPCSHQCFVAQVLQSHFCGCFPASSKTSVSRDGGKNTQQRLCAPTPRLQAHTGFVVCADMQPPRGELGPSVCRDGPRHTLKDSLVSTHGPDSRYGAQGAFRMV